jgi:hypothetical protein
MNAPGVARSSFDSGELVIWGSSTQDHRVYVDGVEIPALFHPAGFRTTVHPALIDRVSLTPGAAGPDFGRSLGGTIEIDTIPPLTPGLHAELSVDFINASLAGQGELGPAHAFVAARAGYLDRLQAWLAPNTQSIVPIPAYADGAARVSLELDPTAFVSATWLGSHDRYSFGISSPDPSSAQTRTQNRDFHVTSLRYVRSYQDGARVVILPFVGVYSHDDTSRFGTVPALLDTSHFRYGMRAHYSLRQGVALLRVGIDAMAISTAVSRSGTLTLPTREGDLAVFGQPPCGQVNADRWSTYDVNVAPYVRVGLLFGPFSVSPGLRLEIQTLATSRRTPRIGDTPSVGWSALYVRPEPRIETRVELTPWLALGARAGLHHQQPSPEDRSAVFGNPELGLSSGYAIAAGPTFRLLETIKAEITGYYKSMNGLVVRSTDTPPPLAQALVQDGKGRSYGMQTAVELRPSQAVSAAVAYTVSRSERDDGQGGYRLFDNDQTHVLSALLSYEVFGFTLGARARFATGTPRLQVVDAYVDIADDRYDPLFEGAGTARYPAFYSLDLRVERTFIERGFKWSLYLDILNLTDHRNVEEIAYSYDYASQQDITGLPTFAALGARFAL